ncbi:MAG: ankyrin repeat domain-containing protein [candidate division Zixibacteria bacterium]|nr:ankyrin repeat domain-containing protein [candidate division Zixibacteria bacterium]
MQLIRIFFIICLAGLFVSSIVMGNDSAVSLITSPMIIDGQAVGFHLILDNKIGLRAIAAYLAVSGNKCKVESIIFNNAQLYDLSAKIGKISKDGKHLSIGIVYPEDIELPADSILIASIYLNSSSSINVCKLTIDSSIEDPETRLQAIKAYGWDIIIPDFLYSNTGSEGKPLNIAKMNIPKDLLIAAYKGDTLGIKYLIESGKKPNKAIDGNLPIDFAVAEGHLRATQLLMKHGAKINKTQNDQSTLIKSLISCHYDIAEFLINYKRNDRKQRAKINFKDLNKMTALHYAAKCGNPEIVEKLIEAGAKVNVNDIDGKTALYYAAYNGFDNTVNILQNNGAKLGKKSGDKITVSDLLEQGKKRTRRKLDYLKKRSQIIETINSFQVSKTRKANFLKLKLRNDNAFDSNIGILTFNRIDGIETYEIGCYLTEDLDEKSKSRFEEWFSDLQSFNMLALAGGSNFTQKIKTGVAFDLIATISFSNNTLVKKIIH